ncbi:MAG TPA: amidohydrolase family protein [Anaerovoracaceae bacterium]|nr:amidohydrolase family protein [Anaerovoracaceae bacterium]
MLDILLLNGIVITMQGEGTGVINRGAVGIKGDKIQCVGEANEIQEKYKALRTINADGKIIMPGLIDSHTHSNMAITRGLAQDIELWLERGIGPYLNNWTKEDRIAGSKLHILEEVKSGTTTIMDYDLDMVSIAKFYESSGIRARLANNINEFPSAQHLLDLNKPYKFDRLKGEQLLAEGVELMDKYGSSPEKRISALFGPQGVDMVSKDTFMEIKNLSRKYDAMISIHLSQAPFEVDQCKMRYGVSPVEWLEQNGMLNEKLIGAHMHYNTDEENKKCAMAGVKLVFCPNSIGLIDGMISPVNDYIDYGGIVAIGTDQATGNNNANLFSDMKMGAILGKIQKQNPTCLPAWKVLRMCTIEAAEVLGMDSFVGSLEVGKKADVILINTKTPGLTPVLCEPIRNVVPNLVYAGTGADVEMSIIDGKIIMEDKKILTMDEDEIIDEAQNLAQELVSRAYDELVDVDSDILRLMNYY